VALPVIYTEAVRRGFALDDIAKWMSSAPSALAGLSGRAGALEVGREANFVVFDTEAAFRVAADRLHYRHAISAYMGETLRGVVRATYLRGEPVYREGRLSDMPRGREVALS
jgi:allantoinase